ncbi:MAG TPA: response regulator [Pirellulales bacterium]|jgi:CheY-like chemotaxis protein|nr:response regulator [Pirellulales bacterium]
MSSILIAEDSPTQAIQIKHLLITAGFRVEAVPDGIEALAAIERSPPDLVLTDLDMPRMNGLELVEAVHRRFPRVPVILMTAFGSDEVAARALEAGAASYVPKRNLEKDLLETIRDLLAVVEADREQARLSEFLIEYETRFELGNDLAAIAPIVAHVQADMAELKLVDETERTRVGIALEAALRSALHRGNPAWIETRLARDEAVFVVGHEGPGYDSTKLLGGNDTARLGSEADDGWLLVKSFMDRVTLSADGTQVTLIKRAAR